MSLKKSKNHLLKHIFISFLLILFCFASCKMRAEQKSLTTQFEIIDALISTNQFDDAERELKKIQKKVYDSWSYIGIFKRYKMLADYDQADKVILQALKKNPENQELLAVYTDFLLEECRNENSSTRTRTVSVKSGNQKSLEKALEYGIKLKNGKYASLFSEAILLKYEVEFKDKTQEELNLLYKNDDFYSVYYDAYHGSKSPLWLRNCAVINLVNGQYNAAANLSPGIFADADDAYFWALVLYDAEEYYKCVDALKTARTYFDDFTQKNIFKTSSVKLAALESDAYYALNLYDKAENARQKGIPEKQDFSKLTEDEQKLLPLLMTNSAVWAKYNGDKATCADLLFTVVTNWPDYVPGLIQYADFAYESNLEREENFEIKALRKAGLSTLEMEKYDSRRKIPLSDALYRINSSLLRKQNPYLEIKKMDLAYKTDFSKTQKEKDRDLWNFLENNYYSAQDNRALIIEYAVHYLLNQKQTDEAWKVFLRYVKEIFVFDEKTDFWTQFVSQMTKLDLRLLEYAGYFAQSQGLYDETLRIYEYCVFESSGILEENQISPNVSNMTCMNLADIYYSNGNKDKALNLYGKTATREMQPKRRSEIYYRIALIYADSSDKKNASRAAETAKQIYPENAKASLLLDKLK